MKDLEHHLLGKHPRIGFAEGTNPDVIRTVMRHVENSFTLPVLIGHREEILWHAKELGANISDVEIADMENFASKAEMVSRMLMIRRGDQAGKACEDKLKDISYFSTIYLELGYIDGLVGGVTATTAETMRPALQLVRTAENERTISSYVLLERDSIHYTMGDCTLNMGPPVQELMEITLQCAKTTRQFGVEPRVGILSHSPFGSGSGESVDRVRVIAGHPKRMPLDFAIDGGIQVDATISPVVARVKASRSVIAGEMNTLIFPNIDAGSIGYKIAIELGGFTTFGPILQDLHKPVNILTRRTSVDTIYSIGIIIGVQAVENRS